MINIQDAKLDHAAAIARIEALLQGHHAWSLSQIQAAFTANAVVRIALDAERAVGYAISQYVLDDAELHIIGVHPDYQRRGIAGQLLTTLLTTLQEKNITQVFLEVRVSNTAAISLYQMCGFETVGRRKGYYAIQVETGNTAAETLQRREDALVMCCRL